VTLPPSNVGSTTVTLNGTVNPLSTNSYGKFRLFGPNGEIATAGYQVVGSGSASVQIEEDVTSLSALTNYSYMTVALNDAGQKQYGAIIQFATISVGSVPNITDPTVGQITDTTAQVACTFDTGGVACILTVEYGTTTAYGLSENTAIAAGDTSEYVPLSGLSASTAYHVRVTISNQYGSASSVDVQFTTGAASQAPTGVSFLPSNINANYATFNAIYNPNGLTTSVLFKYALTIAELNGPNALTIAAPLSSSSSSPLTFTAIPLGLDAFTIYYYRAIATNSGGSVQGKIVKFRTAGGTSFGLLTVSTTTPAANISDVSAVVKGTIDTSDSTAYIFEYWITGQDSVFTRPGYIDVLVSVSDVPPIPVFELLSGLIPSTTYNFRLLASSQADPDIQVGTTRTLLTLALPAIPSATGTVFQPTGVNSVSMLCSGLVNTQNSETTVRFEASLTDFALLEGTSADVVMPAAVGQSTVPNTIIVGLDPDTIYNIRARYINYVVPGPANTSYSDNYVSQRTNIFTLPIVDTALGATQITQISAVANVSITVPADIGSGTVWAYWEYGPAPASSATLIQTQSVNLSGTPPNPGVYSGQIQIGGPGAPPPLIPNSDYFYRAVAYNNAGSVTSTPDETFSTLPGGTGADAVPVATGYGEALPNSFIMRGTLYTQSSSTDVVFEYINIDLGEVWASARTTPLQTVAASTKLEQIGATTGFLLEQSARWQFRIKAVNGTGVTAYSYSLPFQCNAVVVADTASVVNTAVGISSFKDMESVRLRFDINHRGQYIGMQLEWATSLAGLASSPTKGRLMHLQCALQYNPCRYADYITGLAANTTYYYQLRCWSSGGEHTGVPVNFTTDASGGKWSASWAASVGSRNPARNCMGTIPANFITGTGTITTTNPVNFIDGSGSLSYSSAEDAYSIIVNPSGVTCMPGHGGASITRADSGTTSNIAYAITQARVGDKVWVDSSAGFVYAGFSVGETGSSSRASWPNNVPVTGVRILPLVDGTSIACSSMDFDNTAGGVNGVYVRGFAFDIGLKSRNYTCGLNAGNGSGGVGVVGIYETTMGASNINNFGPYGIKTHIRFDGPSTLDIRGVTFSPAREHSVYCDSVGEINPQDSLMVDCAVSGLSLDGLYDANGNTFVQWVSRAAKSPHGAGFPPPRGTHYFLRCTARSGTTGPTAFSFNGHMGTIDITDCTVLGSALQPNLGGALLITDDGVGKGTWFGERGYSNIQVDVSNFTVSSTATSSSLFKITNCQTVNFGTFLVGDSVAPQRVFDLHAIGVRENGRVSITGAGASPGALQGYTGWGSVSLSRRIYHDNNPIQTVDFDDLSTGKQYSTVV